MMQVQGRNTKTAMLEYLASWSVSLNQPFAEVAASPPDASAAANPDDWSVEICRAQLTLAARAFAKLALGAKIDVAHREQLLASIRSGEGPAFLPFSTRPLEFEADGSTLSIVASPESEAMAACNFRWKQSPVPLRWELSDPPPTGR